MLLMEMAGQQYCLRWNNYQSNMTSVFHHLLRTEAFVDVTLACNDDSLKAHKVVLSACSSYFQKILLDNPSQHPTIIMPQDVCFTDLKFIIEFVYRGEIDVSQEELQSLLKTADQLKIKGLCEVPEGTNSKDMPGAEVTPLPPRLPPSPTTIPSVIPRINRFRKLTCQAKRRLDNRKRLYREAMLQEKQQLEVSQRHAIHHAQQSLHQQTQGVHQSQQQSVHQSQQTLLQHQHQQSHMIQAMVSSVHDSAGQHNQGNSLANCITVATSTEDDLKTEVSVPGGVVILDSRVGPHLSHTDAIMMTSPPPIMSTHSHSQVLLESGLTDVESLTADVGTQNSSPPPSLMSTPPRHQDIAVMTPVDSSHVNSPVSTCDEHEVKVKYETLRAMEQTDLNMDPDRENGHLLSGASGEDSTEHTMHTMMITPELLGLIPTSSSGHQGLTLSASQLSPVSCQADVPDSVKREGTPSKTWTQEDMDAALDALRNHTMSLTKASITYGIPSTTLWQRAHRLGIDTPKKDGPAKSWTEEVLNVALEALRNGSISANKASKAYGIPSSTLYKIARREGIRLAAPFNAAPTSWNPEDLERALEAIRSGQTTVQRAAVDFGIPSGTLYGRCKREGIELSRSNPTPWSEDAMIEALEAVRLGQMSINQAAIHYNLPYSSLYGRFKRVKYEAVDHPSEGEEGPPTTSLPAGHQIMLVQYQQPTTLYQHTPS